MFCLRLCRHAPGQLPYRRGGFFMNDEFYDDAEYERAAQARRERRRKRRRQAMIRRTISLIVLAIVFIGAAVFAGSRILKKQNGTTSSPAQQPASVLQTEKETAAPAQAEAQPIQTEAQTEKQTVTSSSQEDTLTQAQLLAAGYDYDGAIALLQSIPDYESDATVTAAIQEYETTKSSCVAVDVTTIPHIFYHSLVNDPSAAFNAATLGQAQADGMNAWMTTVDEFDKITQQLYDNGYVYVRLHDLVTETTDADGTVHFTPNQSLMLPPGKKAIVLSVDDLSYYHSYEPASFPDKLVIDENGDVKCHYVKTDGSENIGDFDVVPRLNTFLKEHPDGAYKGARGTIALTGYNGVFGYRTDTDYKTKENLLEDQRKWLDEHPDFNWDDDVAEATKIADALKEEGWDFASHTWGHLSVTGKSVDTLRTDNEKWVNTVQNIVGPTDTIIFAHGNDIGSWEGYTSDNEIYNYFKSVGYNFYCNVDSSQPYWVQITDQYVRQGRIDLDGYLLYQASTGQTSVLDNMITASEIFDQRRPTPVVANGES